jgi:hypothetical protein
MIKNMSRHVIREANAGFVFFSKYEYTGLNIPVITAPSTITARKGSRSHPIIKIETRKTARKNHTIIFREVS